MAADDPADLIKQLVSGLSLQEQRELLTNLLNRRAATFLDDLRQPKLPTLHRKPRTVRGFQVRLDLRGAKPPVWRRLVLPGDLTLDRLHSVIQAAMGWYDSHLHQFRTGTEYNAPCFITEFDIEEGDEGILENTVRLDQVVAEAGDRLWYEYDFGDGWHHVLKVEKVLPAPPEEVVLVSGKRACPPEDCGGIGGYEALAEWVEGGYDDAVLPEWFEDADHARDWLPVGWHPAVFDIDQARADLGRRQ